MILNTVKMFHNMYPFETQSHGIDFSFRDKHGKLTL